MDINEQRNSGSARHPWELARLSILVELINKEIPVSNDLKIVVDVGCGDCFFASHLLKSRADLRIVAIDPGYSKTEIQNKLVEINDSRFSLFPDLQQAAEFIRDQKVDLILFLDVLEHISLDRKFLTDSVNAFNMDEHSRVMISVPAFQSLFSEHDKFLKHCRRYNMNSLQQLIQQSKLLPVSSGYFFLSLLPIRLGQKIIESVGRKNEQKGIGDWRGSSSLSLLLKNYLLFDFKFSKLLDKVGIKVPGLSVYSICKKPAS